MLKSAVRLSEWGESNTVLFTCIISARYKYVYIFVTSNTIFLNALQLKKNSYGKI